MRVPTIQTFRMMRAAAKWKFVLALEQRTERRWRQRKIAAFRQLHGYAPNLDKPETFSEKLLRRILSGSDPHYRLYGVKLAAPYFARSRAIEGLRFARHLKIVKRMKPEDFVDLPEAFTIKSSFGSGLNEVVRKKSQVDIPALCEMFNSRIRTVTNAQNATDPDNAIIFEAFLGDPDLGTPNDYKFHCFHGKDAGFECFIQVDSDRFGTHRQTIFDASYTPVDMQFAGQVRHDTPPPRPRHLDDMLRIAQELSTGFDYIRVDLFDTDDGVFFGELTPFHQGAMTPISPVEWEYRLGQLWEQRFPIYQPV